MGRITVFLCISLIFSGLALATTGEIPVMPLKDRLEKSDDIFIGKVKKVEKLSSLKADGSDMRAEIEVIKSFKGKKKNPQVVYFYSTRSGNEKDAPVSIENVGSFFIIFTNGSLGGRVNTESGSTLIPPFPDAAGEFSSSLRCAISALEAYSQKKSMDEVLEISYCYKKKKRP
ncbi:MAG: hypothetical protein AB7K68_00170 [Bacteriovoracia bacterium]